MAFKASEETTKTAFQSGMAPPMRKRPFPTEITVLHKGQNYPINVDEEINIDPLNFQDACYDQPGKFAWYSAVHAGAMTLVDRTKRSLEVTKGRVATRFRGTKDVNTGKTFSETAIDKLLDTDPEVIEAYERYVSAQEQEYLLKAVKEAFVHRRDMLTQIGADRRQELRDKGF
jgi:hypothetical protein